MVSTKISSTCILYDVTYQSSECSQRISGEIIGVPRLTGYSTGGYKFASCGCKPSSYSLQSIELCYSKKKASTVHSKHQTEIFYVSWDVITLIVNSFYTNNSDHNSP